MGHIVPRKRKDGSTGYTVQIVIKKDGSVAHREARTFNRRQAANAWMVQREKELSKTGAIERERQKDKDPPLAAVIDKYIASSERKIGRTKAQVLRTIKTYDIANMKCSQITSADILSFAKALPAGPATRQNYLSHISAVFKLAQPAWEYPLDYNEIKKAFVVTKDLGVTAKGKQRERRPTLDELDRLMDHFGTVKARRPDSIPMQTIVPFAIFSTRRQEEITRIRWEDYDAAHDGDPARVLVRDMKHPGDKIGNNVWVELTPEAAAYIDSMPRAAAEIFPFTTDAISAAFTRACAILGINTPEMADEARLHFHDLRHEGVSRLFEMGRTIPQVAAVSGHRSWTSLKRYSHIRKVGDKFANWKWRTPTH